MRERNNVRKNYLDNIRWVTVLLVLIYHVFYMFNGVGILGGIPQAKNIAVFDIIAAILYPWFMVLLFLIAGISARYALQKRTAKQFIKERAVKLIVPSTLGLFVIHWITGYLNIKMGGGLAYIPTFLIYPIAVISGTGPLWFIQMLFIFSCILVLLTKADKSDKIWKIGANVKLPMLPLLFVLIFLAAQVLNMPVLTMYRFGIYLVSFLIGYYIFSNERVQEMAENIRVPMLCVSAISMAFYVLRYRGGNYTSSACLQSLITNFTLWMVVLTIIGYGRKYLNCETAFTRRMTKSSFGIYILHYPVLIVTCYILNTYFDLLAIWNYVTALVVAFVMTFLLYEALRRIPFVRFAVLGVSSLGPQGNCRCRQP